MSTLISSVCTEIDLDGTGTCIETWQPASLKCWGRTGSRGVAGVEVGGCNWIDGTMMGGGGGARLGDGGGGGGASVCVDIDAVTRVAGIGGGGGGALVGDTGVLGGLRGSSKV